MSILLIGHPKKNHGRMMFTGPVMSNVQLFSKVSWSSGAGKPRCCFVRPRRERWAPENSKPPPSLPNGLPLALDEPKGLDRNTVMRKPFLTTPGNCHPTHHTHTLQTAADAQEAREKSVSALEQYRLKAASSRLEPRMRHASRATRHAADGRNWLSRT